MPCTGRAARALHLLRSIGLRECFARQSDHAASFRGDLSLMQNAKNIDAREQLLLLHAPAPVPAAGTAFGAVAGRGTGAGSRLESRILLVLIFVRQMGPVGQELL